MEKLFVDTDICLDLLSGRMPHNKFAEILFTRADKEQLILYISALSFANIDYVLRSQYTAIHSRQLLARFKTLVNVLPVNSNTIDLALASKFNDFEDAIQYSCAIENNLGIIITRNLKDCKNAKIKVMTAEMFLS